MSEPLVSVLLPVHGGVEPAFLRECLDSLLAQTRRADEVIVVQDGPLEFEHDHALDVFERDHSGVCRVRLQKNQGAGIANRTGLLVASGRWIAKVDADDICHPSRFERQLDAVQRAGVDLCGAAMLEFVDDPSHVVSRRSMPLTHEAVVRRLPWNNPINHPTAFYRRETALARGGYPTWRHMQDYGLFALMIADGAMAMNLPDDLVYFRSGRTMLGRRRGRQFLELELSLQLLLVNQRIVGRPQMLLNLIWRLAYRFLPRRVMSVLHNRALARPGQCNG